MYERKQPYQHDRIPTPELNVNLDLAELNAINTLNLVAQSGGVNTVDLDASSLEVLEPPNPEEIYSSLPEDWEADEREDDQIGAARSSSEYRKTHFDDAVGAFFKEMARYPLLKAEEEVELARRVRFLVEVEELQKRLQKELNNQAGRGELLTALEISDRQLEHRLYLGRVAKRKMIRSNLRLVVSIAKRYLNRGLPFLDLIQEGAMGLNRATEKFDPDKGYKFSTYAYWWIRQAITRAIANDSRTIRLPIHVVEKLNKLKTFGRTCHGDSSFSLLATIGMRAVSTSRGCSLSNILAYRVSNSVSLPLYY